MSQIKDNINDLLYCDQSTYRNVSASSVINGRIPLGMSKQINLDYGTRGQKIL